MNEASFIISLKESEKLLKNLGLIKRNNYSNSGRTSYKKYSQDFLYATRKGTYSDIYKCAMENDDYDFLLQDGSFFQFTIDTKGKHEDVRMAYYPSLCKMEYEEFLIEYLGVKEEECGAEYIDLFQQYVIEQDPEKITPVRYDYNIELYEEIIHSAAHLHIGYEENIRIPIKKRMKPLLFTKMIIEFFYYEKWKNCIKNGNNSVLYKTGDLEELEAYYFSKQDEKVPYINL